MITFYIPKDISEVDAAALSNLAGFYQWQGTPYKVVKIGEKMPKKYKLPKWPPTWAHVEPKVKKHYKHTVNIVSKSFPREQLRELALRVLEEDRKAEKEFTELYIGFDFNFTSEPRAKAFRKTALEATNDILVEYERKELPTFNEERIEI